MVYIKINQKQIIDLSIKDRTKKIQKKNIRVKFYDLLIGEDFLCKTQKKHES